MKNENNTKTLKESELKKIIRGLVKESIEEGFTYPLFNGWKYSINGEAPNKEYIKTKDELVSKFIEQVKQAAGETLGVYMREGRFRNLGDKAPWTREELEALTSIIRTASDLHKTIWR